MQIREASGSSGYRAYHRVSAVVFSIVHNGVGTNFGVGVEESRPEGPRIVDGVLGEGTASPSLRTRGLRERCKFPQRGPGRSPSRRRVFLYSEPSDCLSQHLSTCCIQFAWLGIRFFWGGYTIHINIPDINSWGCQIPCMPPLPTPVIVRQRLTLTDGFLCQHLRVLDGIMFGLHVLKRRVLATAND